MERISLFNMFDLYFLNFIEGLEIGLESCFMYFVLNVNLWLVIICLVDEFRKIKYKIFFLIFFFKYEYVLNVKLWFNIYIICLVNELRKIYMKLFYYFLYIKK